jgi:hypothetical protein
MREKRKKLKKKGRENKEKFKFETYIYTRGAKK